MYTSLINKFTLSVSLILTLQQLAWSQQYHFIYFQQEQSVPFYVKYEGQIFRSSPTGYLILSKLVRGKQQVYLGLNDPNQQMLKFVWDSLNSDRGYLIKDFGDSGWGLFDFQTSEIKYPKSKQERNDEEQIKSSKDTSGNDGFGRMLAQVTQDSTLKYVTLQDPVKKVEINSGIIKSQIFELDRGEKDSVREIRFVVREKKSLDTVAVVLGSNVLRPSHSEKKEVTQKDTADNRPVEKKDTLIQRIEKDTVLLDVSDSVIIVRDKGSMVMTGKSSQNNCIKTADEDQFVKLRMRMAGQYTEEKMIEEAYEVFKQTCFTTTQLRRLSLLLSKDEMKYKFFETASKYISDAGQFFSLRNELQEDDYRKRFDLLIANP